MATLRNCLCVEEISPAIIGLAGASPTILSHRQLFQQALMLQKDLAAIGVSPKEAVAIALPNSIEFVTVFLAVAFQRAVCAPLNPAYKKDEFRFYLQDLAARLIIVPDGAILKNSEVVQAAKGCNVAIAEIGWNGSKMVFQMKHFDQTWSQKRAEVEEPEEDDVALILHTSGTTGKPKAVPLSHKNLCQTMSNIMRTYDLTAHDRTLLVMPLFHVHGLLGGLLSSLRSGGSVIIPVRFSASEFWRDFVGYEANWYTAVPTMHQILLRNPLPNPMPRIRFVRSCSSPLSPTVHGQLESSLGAPVLEAYAMTEAAHQMTSNPLPPARRKPGSVGLPQGVELWITDDDGKRLAAGSIGEVCVLGANVTKGYVGISNADGSTFHKTGHLRTGDQGYVDEEGYLFLTGRIKELINKGGEKFSPVEIDNLFAQHPSVLEAVSFAIHDELYGQDIAVAITLKDGFQASSNELMNWFGQRAVKFKIPRKIYFFATMPKTATGKVQRQMVAKAAMAMDQEDNSRGP